MGALEEGRYSEGMTNNGCVDLGSDDEGDVEAAAIQEAVRVSLKASGRPLSVLPRPSGKGPEDTGKRRGTSSKVHYSPQLVWLRESVTRGGAGGLVVVRDLDLFSYCDPCLLPSQIKCHLGYIPSGQRVIGLSKLSRVAEVFAKRLQDPQRLASEVCSALQNSSEGSQ